MVTKALLLLTLLAFCFQNTIAIISNECVDPKFQEKFDPSDIDKNGLLSEEEFCSSLKQHNPEGYETEGLEGCKYVFMAWEINGDQNLSCRGMTILIKVQLLEEILIERWKVRYFR